MNVPLAHTIAITPDFRTAQTVSAHMNVAVVKETFQAQEEQAILAWVILTF